MRQLADGFAQGRLDSRTFEDRTDRALIAVTHNELTAITADLPGDRQTADRRDRADWLMEARWWVAGAVILTGVWLVQHMLSDDGVRYWPALPLAIWGLILIGAVIVPRSSQGNSV